MLHRLAGNEAGNDQTLQLVGALANAQQRRIGRMGFEPGANLALERQIFGLKSMYMAGVLVCFRS
ncbi:hypothetical protein [Noviherbaspirillum suwonense]|uniref:hypothetical protein n=1 Tax=Noviherbaspirillum suwonense TaxID=1224511 RepID=UPI0024B6D394|nr:hypothetical protein [Noviherbaspirillum suwonense]